MDFLTLQIFLFLSAAFLSAGEVCHEITKESYLPPAQCVSTDTAGCLTPEAPGYLTPSTEQDRKDNSDKQRIKMSSAHSVREVTTTADGSAPPHQTIVYLCRAPGKKPEPELNREEHLLRFTSPHPSTSAVPFSLSSFPFAIKQLTYSFISGRLSTQRKALAFITLLLPPYIYISASALLDSHFQASSWLVSSSVAAAQSSV